MSATLNASGEPARILAAYRQGLFALVISEPMLEEVEEVLKRPRIARKYGVRPKDATGLVKLLRRHAVVADAFGKQEIRAIFRREARPYLKPAPKPNEGDGIMGTLDAVIQAQVRSQCIPDCGLCSYLWSARVRMFEKTILRVRWQARRCTALRKLLEALLEVLGTGHIRPDLGGAGVLSDPNAVEKDDGNLPYYVSVA